jgi:hypothetical protein
LKDEVNVILFPSVSSISVKHKKLHCRACEYCTVDTYARAVEYHYKMGLTERSSTVTYPGHGALHQWVPLPLHNILSCFMMRKTPA